MSRLIALLYGLICYAFFSITFTYAIAFVEDFPVPRTIDSGVSAPTAEAFVVNMLLMALFAMQHSVMARPQFKAWWTQFVPKSVERSTYVLLSTLLLALLCWQWRPIPAVVWRVDDPLGAAGQAPRQLLPAGLTFVARRLIRNAEPVSTTGAGADGEVGARRNW